MFSSREKDCFSSGNYCMVISKGGDAEKEKVISGRGGGEIYKVSGL